MKDLWFKQLERLEVELGRKPTTEEVAAAAADHLAELADRAKDEAKYEGNVRANRDEQPVPGSSGDKPRDNS